MLDAVELALMTLAVDGPLGKQAIDAFEVVCISNSRVLTKSSFYVVELFVEKNEMCCKVCLNTTKN
jgi:hypothetical protein